jgi:hypothetical protein
MAHIHVHGRNHGAVDRFTDLGAGQGSLTGAFAGSAVELKSDNGDRPEKVQRGVHEKAQQYLNRAAYIINSLLEHYGAV